jgi:hypothetical protein
MESSGNGIFMNDTCRSGECLNGCVEQCGALIIKYSRAKIVDCQWGVLGMVFQVIHCLPNHWTCFYYCFHSLVKLFWVHLKISLFTHCSTSKETSLKPLPKITKHSPKFWNGSPKKTHTHTHTHTHLTTTIWNQFAFTNGNQRFPYNLRPHNNCVEAKKIPLLVVGLVPRIHSIRRRGMKGRPRWMLIAKN